MPPIFINSESLGSRLIALREKEKLTQDQVAREIRAPLSFIEALEEDNYAVFPARVYTEGYFKKYLGLLSLSGEEMENLMRELRIELDVGSISKIRNLAPLRERSTVSRYLYPFKIPVVIGFAAVFIFTSFIVVRLGAFLGKPELSINEPFREAVADDHFTYLRGKVEKESRLTVNGREITIDQYGNFDERFELAAGLNILEFLVEDRFGKMNKEIRYILVK
ncbi:MAG: helix-turn-helix domain-containing protein [Candidatus Sungbacteria bacterium]|nr:helix-turn-helix domain-containing protein [Candidatus Sungbacteria bacterium]